MHRGLWPFGTSRRTDPWVCVGLLTDLGRWLTHRCEWPIGPLTFVESANFCCDVSLGHGPTEPLSSDRPEWFRHTVGRLGSGLRQGSVNTSVQPSDLRSRRFAALATLWPIDRQTFLLTASLHSLSLQGAPRLLSATEPVQMTPSFIDQRCDVREAAICLPWRLDGRVIRCCQCLL